MSEVPLWEKLAFSFPHHSKFHNQAPHLLEYVRAPWQGTGVEGFSDATSENPAKVLTSLI